MPKEVYIVSAARTPIGGFLGSLSSLTATQLGAEAIKAVLERANVKTEAIEEVYMGNVLSAGLGQNPARQAATFAGLGNQVVTTTVNKVCASGTKAVALAAQAIKLGERHLVVAGGMESMSNVPFYTEGARNGIKFGHQQLTDGLIKDGLWDVYNDYHMGNAAEKCSTDYNISREEQDAHATESYKRAARAHEKGKFKDEIVPIEIKGRKETVTVDEDEDYKKVVFDKLGSLRPVFKREGGTVTAANASNLNDGAAAVLLASEEAVKKHNLKPIARIISYADNEQAPEDFTTSPVGALTKALERANKAKDDIDFFEINEAFSVVALANERLLGISSDKINVNGGAVALGHPLGCSGTRILVTLLSVLEQNSAQLGAVGICNGGGGASALIVERV